MEIELSMNISEQDYCKINEEIYAKREGFAKWFYKIVIGIIVFSMLFPIIEKVINGNIIEDWFLTIFSVAFSFLLIFGMSKLRKYQFKRVYQKNKSILETINYKVDDEFIDIKSSLSEAKQSWKGIIQVQELTEWFLLRPNTVSFYALPKNQLNPSQQAWLRNKITKN